MYKDKEKERAMRRKNYWKNLEVSRAKSRRNKRSQLSKRGESINAYQREWYSRDAACNAKKQNERRRARNPHIGLRKAIRDCERGALSIYELVERVGDSFARSNETNGAPSRKRPGRRRLYGAGNTANF